MTLEKLIELSKEWVAPHISFDKNGKPYKVEGYYRDSGPEASEVAGALGAMTEKMGQSQSLAPAAVAKVQQSLNAQTTSAPSAPSHIKSGRGPTGKLRNFKSMAPAKFDLTVSQVLSENNDQEAMDAILSEASSRGYNAKNLKDMYTPKAPPAVPKVEAVAKVEKAQGKTQMYGEFIAPTKNPLLTKRETKSEQKTKPGDFGSPTNMSNAEKEAEGSMLKGIPYSSPQSMDYVLPTTTKLNPVSGAGEYVDDNSVIWVMDRLDKPRGWPSRAVISSGDASTDFMGKNYRVSHDQTGQFLGVYKFVGYHNLQTGEKKGYLPDRNISAAVFK